MATIGMSAKRVQYAALQTQLERLRVQLDVQSEELQRAQAQQAELAQLQGELFDGTPTSCLILDRKGVILRANAAASELLGIVVTPLVGQRIGRFVAERSSEALSELLSSLQREARASCLLWLQRCEDGQLVARAHGRRVQSPPGAWLVMLTALCEGSAPEPDRLRELGMRAAAIAHDLNNLLSGVVVGAELALRTPELDEALRESLAIIERSARDASELTAQVLGSATGGRKTCPTDLQQVLADCRELLRSRVHDRLRLTTELVHDLPLITSARAQVQRVLLNLLINAIEAIGDAAGGITVSARVETLDRDDLRGFCHASSAHPGRFAIVTVADTGCGMDAPTAARLFEPFVSTKAKGHGLGLASVLEVVSSQACAIRVASQLGLGTRFEVAFPAAATAEALAPALASAPQPAFGASLLMIDDEPLLCTALCRTLGMLGFEVRAAHDGEQGLALLARSDTHFDAVLLDWSLPNMSGRSVLNELRRSQPNLPVVVMSGYGVERLPAELDSTPWLQKPVDLERLRCSLREALAGRGPRITS